MDKLLQEYVGMFNENFPFFSVSHLDEADIKEIIRKAIKENKPFEADYEDEGAY